MRSDDWTEFTKRIAIRASAQKVYDYWATQTGLEKWFLRKAEFKKADNTPKPKDNYVQKGDKYEWLWYGHPDTVAERNTIRNANGKDFLQFKFAGDCLVSVRIIPGEEETIVELTQEDIPPDDNPVTNLFISCAEGWTFYLANLKSILEGGIDLRNKNVKVLNVINA
jgi:uncharacterized protein YndB with AHSA1/START domain